MTTNQMTSTDWMVREAKARVAANRWAASAHRHEQEAKSDPWSKSRMVAMAARDNEARCRDAAVWAAQMAKA